MREGEPEWTVRRLSRSKQIRLWLAELPPYQLHHLRVKPPIPRTSAPVSTGCLLLYCGPLGCKLLEETTISFRTTGEFGMPVCSQQLMFFFSNSFYSL